DLVPEAREILDAAAADEHDRVLLEVVPLAGDVGADLHGVRQPHAGDLPESRVRLLRGGRVDARADAALLRGARERRGLVLRDRGFPALPNQLLDRRHGSSSSPRASEFPQRDGWLGGEARPTDPRHGTESRNEPSNRSVEPNPAVRPIASSRFSDHTPTTLCGGSHTYAHRGGPR